MIPGTKERRGGRTRTTWPKSSHGPGWGGPAKGAGNGNSRAPALAGAADHGAGPGRGQMTPAGADRRERNEQMKEILATVAEDDEAPHMARIIAADKWLDRDEGKPLQRTENLNTNTKDAAYAVLRNASPATRASLRAVLQQAQIEAQAVEIGAEAESGGG
jgi:hypothetical protein